jgi:hypothetical protein
VNSNLQLSSYNLLFPKHFFIFPHASLETPPSGTLSKKDLFGDAILYIFGENNGGA